MSRVTEIKTYCFDRIQSRDLVAVCMNDNNDKITVRINVTFEARKFCG